MKVQNRNLGSFVTVSVDNFNCDITKLSFLVDFFRLARRTFLNSANLSMGTSDLVLLVQQ